jgi:hypothetical protein
MPTAVAPLVREITDRAQLDSSFAEVLEAIRDAPTQPQGAIERTAAHALNLQRRNTVVQEFVEGSLPTPKVQELLGLKTPQAVHRLRTRGKLLGMAVGNRTWFPAWQFDDNGLQSELPQILERLAHFTSDPIAADRVMRLTHDELDGASIARALRREDTADTAWRMLAALGA